MTTEKLLPCPFCGARRDMGSPPLPSPGMEDCGYHYVTCCDVHVHRDSSDESHAAWNTRALTAPAGVEVEGLVRKWRAEASAIDLSHYDEYSPGSAADLSEHSTLIYCAYELATALAKPVEDFEAKVRNEESPDLIPLRDKARHEGCGFTLVYCEADNTWYSTIEGLTKGNALLAETDTARIKRLMMPTDG